MTLDKVEGLGADWGLALSEIEVGTHGPATRIAARFEANGTLCVPSQAKPQGFDGWVASRQVEFAAGRVLAQAALADFGHSDPVGRAASRAPIWPAGVSGAITHFNDFATVLVARGTWRVGIDVTEVPETGKTFDALRTAAITDRDHLAKDLPPRVAETLIFSAKETLFKALFPEVQTFFGFNAARVMSVGDGVLTLELTQDLPKAKTPALRQGASFTLDWSQKTQRIETRMVAPAGT